GTPGAPTPERPAAPRPRTGQRARRPPARRRAPRSCRALPCPCGLEAGELAELVVAEARGEVPERLVARAPVDPPTDEADDRCVELLGRHPPEERPADLRPGAEPAAHEDVVRLPPGAAVIPGGRALEAEIADPVLRAGVGAPVEVQAQAAELGAETPLEVL